MSINSIPETIDNNNEEKTPALVNEAGTMQAEVVQPETWRDIIEPGDAANFHANDDEPVSSPQP